MLDRVKQILDPSTHTSTQYIQLQFLCGASFTMPPKINWDKAGDQPNGDRSD